MADHDTPNSSAATASKPKKPRTKLTPEQRLARLEQQTARVRAEMRENSRKLQTRGKIIFGAGCLHVVFNEMPDTWRARFMKHFWSHVSERDRRDLLNSGLLPDAVTLDNTDDTKKPDPGSDSSETDEKSGD